ncbi:MAG: glucose 1-dehydrogenase [Acidobacteriaceae bacterium]
MQRLAGKVAVVTGASKGIGAAIAQSFAVEGAAVVVNYLSSKAGADRVVGAIAAGGGRAVAVQADVSKQVEIVRLFAETKRAFGRLDVLVNNAALYEFKPLEEVDEEHFQRLFHLNVLGLVLTTQEAVRHFGEEGGSVINIGSTVSRLTPPNASVYTVSEAAVDALTGSLAKELGPRRIRVNSINPGLVETDGYFSGGFGGSEFERTMVAQTPLGRTGQTDDIAPIAVFLASAESGWLTGETLLASGGVR